MRMERSVILNAPSRTINWGKIILVIALMLPMLASAPAINAAPRVHPDLMQAATQHPTMIVTVIVQKQGADKSVEDTVVRLGGKVTKDLHIINAFVAEMPAKAVLELARSPSRGGFADRSRRSSRSPARVRRPSRAS